MSRSRTRERREERQRQQRQQRQFMLLGGLVALVVLALVVLILSNQPAEAPIPEGSVERYSGIPQSLTDDGYPILGNPDAPVQVVEYSSFACSACKSFHDQAMPALVDRVRAGEVAFTYVPLYTFGSVQNGEGAARAALCAGEQGAFWTYHDALFSWQGLYGNTAFAQNRLETGIDNLGLNRAEWEQCMGSEMPRTVANAAEAEARSIDGFTGTPAIMVNGSIVTNELQSVMAAIDQALAFSPPPVPETEASTEPESSGEATDEAAAETTETP
jgi:protein-disulfide isomerase